MVVGHELLLLRLLLLPSTGSRAFGLQQLRHVGSAVVVPWGRQVLTGSQVSF